jgi:hypothetical protein
MTYQGTVVNGAIVLDGGLALPEGAKVVIAVAEESPSGCSEASPTLRDTLMKFAGCMTDLPNDFADQHDHYVHGTPKR